MMINKRLIGTVSESKKYIAMHRGRAGSFRGGSSASALFPVSAAGSVLFCEKLREVTQLVYRDEAV